MHRIGLGRGAIKITKLEVVYGIYIVIEVIEFTAIEVNKL